MKSSLIKLSNIFCLQIFIMSYSIASQEESQDPFKHNKISLVNIRHQPQMNSICIQNLENGNYFQELPIELIYHVTHFLNPDEILKLSYANKFFNKIFDDKFWRVYNLNYNYEKFGFEERPAIKIAFGIYWYNIGLTCKAATLGYPETIQIIHYEKKEDKITNKKWTVEKWADFIENVSKTLAYATSHIIPFPILQPSPFSTLYRNQH